MKLVRVQEKSILIGFTILQSITAMLCFEIMNRYNLGLGKNLLSFTINLLFYVLILFVPIFLYLKFYDRTETLTFLRFNKNVVSGFSKGIIIGLFIFLVMLWKNEFHLSKDLNLIDNMFFILGRLLVGFFEEVPFRGFYLQKFREYIGFWRANLLSAGLFAIMHIPGKLYIESGSINSVFIILLIGLWMGFIFKETDSLWCASVVHSLYNLSLYIVS